MPKTLSTQLKFAIQLFILFMVYELYAILTIFYLYETSVVNNKYAADEGHYKNVKLLRWIYHSLNPIVYLFSHPNISNYLKSKINYFKLFKLKKLFTKA